MRRALEPHGTKAGYMRHWRAGEEACEPCKKAKTPTRKPARESNPNNREQTAYDRIIAANPPSIVWRKNSHGVLVAVSVKDPHAETKAQREWDDRMTRERATLEAMGQEAREVAARFEQHRANNTPLMTAAKRTI